MKRRDGSLKMEEHNLLLVGWMKDLCIRDLVKEVGMDAPAVLKICSRKKRIHKYQAQGTVLLLQE
jgi:hypothetical protein